MTLAGPHLIDASAYLGDETIHTNEVGRGSRIEISSILREAADSRYEVSEEIGRGAMGLVCEARDLNIRRTVALKKLLPDNFALEQGVFRLVEEAQITGQLEHSAIVPVYDLGLNAEGQVFYTMKRVRGKTLADILKGIREGRHSFVRGFSLMHLLRIFLRTCDAIAFAHSKGVIHRDLKPQNIMVEDYGEVFVMDWGLAMVLTSTNDTRQRMARKESRKLGAEGAKGLRERVESVRDDLGAGTLLTHRDEIMGTPPFMAPEQIRSDEEGVGPLADIYALGAILYTILTLRPPLADETVRDILWHTVQGKIVPPADVLPGRAASKTNRCQEQTGKPSTGYLHLQDGRVPEPLSAVAMKAMSVAPGDRYQSVSELQAEIDAYMSGFATSAERAGFLRQLRLLVRRNRLLVGGACTILALMVGVGIVAYTRNARSRQRTQAALEQLRQSAPAFAAQARLHIVQQRMTEALAAARHAVKLMPDCADYHSLVGDVLQTLGHYGSSASAYRQVLDLAPNEPHATRNLALSRQLLHKRKAELLTPQMLRAEQRLNLLRQKREDEAAFLDEETNDSLSCRSWAVNGWNLPEGWRLICTPRMPGFDISLAPCKRVQAIQNIPPVLKGIRAAGLDLTNTSISDLSPLAGEQLQRLSLTGTKVTDLSPLTGMQLERLNISRTHVVNLAPLANMPLKVLDLSGCGLIDDFTPLASLCQLRALVLPPQAIGKDLSFLRRGKATPYLDDLSIQGVTGSTKRDADVFWRDYGCRHSRYHAASEGDVDFATLYREAATERRNVRIAVASDFEALRDEPNSIDWNQVGHANGRVSALTSCGTTVETFALDPSGLAGIRVVAGNAASGGNALLLRDSPACRHFWEPLLQFRFEHEKALRNGRCRIAFDFFHPVESLACPALFVRNYGGRPPYETALSLDCRAGVVSFSDQHVPAAPGVWHHIDIGFNIGATASPQAQLTVRSAGSPVRTVNATLQGTVDAVDTIGIYPGGCTDSHFLIDNVVVSLTQ